MADFGGEAAEAFRAETRDWLKAHFPAQLKGRNAFMYMEGAAPSEPDVREWTAAMGETGWGGPTWPKAYGGGGLEPGQTLPLQTGRNAAGAREPLRCHGVPSSPATPPVYRADASESTHIPPAP